MRRSRAIVALIALAAALLAAPTGVVAAEPGTVTVTGNVTREGAGVAGANVVVTVTGRDQAVAAVTDDAGDFTADIEASVGDGIVVFASGQTSRSEPDAQGCVHTETPTGSTTTTLDEVPPAPVEVVLDTVLTDTVCTPTPSPKPTPGATHRPRASSAPRAGVTPPTTDATGSGTGTTAGSGLAIVLAGLALVAAGLLARTGRRARS
jgi:hypothetical protein